MFILDTNIVSELFRGRPHGAVVAWLGSASPDSYFVSAVTFGELQRGVELCRDSKPERAAAIERWIDRISTLYAVLPMDERGFRAHARLMHRRPQTLFEDAMIAATALVHGLTVATRNVRDFAALGVNTFNPFGFRDNV